MFIKYPKCSFRIDAILRYSKEDFIKAYLGTACFAGSKQAEMLADCYDKAELMAGIKNVEDTGEVDSSPAVPSEMPTEPETNDDSTDGPELG